MTDREIGEMTRKTFEELEQYMRFCMEDSAHDSEHIYRVLSVALEIANHEGDVNFDILICACLLHDIGRKEQFEHPELCHAMVGGKKAYRYLKEHGFGPVFAGRVKECIQSHRYREEHPPQSLEAKILFDADKIDVAGAIGIARTLLYQGEGPQPLYLLERDGQVSDGNGDETPSFFREYHFKLKKIYDCFQTVRGREIALEQRETAETFYRSLLKEVRGSREAGKPVLDSLLSE